MKRKNWRSTGWRCSDGRVLEYSTDLPAGIHAEVFRARASTTGRYPAKNPWRFRIGGYDHSTRRYPSAVQAMLACERVLKDALRKSLGMLS